uniref:Alternative protein FAM171A1 n=1 Tax=Homo sapiens TaxID=9606 RepID=L8E7C4_HUMAN|nr:alternative protein FAM171A1 [Homo sapiens]
MNQNQPGREGEMLCLCSRTTRPSKSTSRKSLEPQTARPTRSSCTWMTWNRVVANVGPRSVPPRTVPCDACWRGRVGEVVASCPACRRRRPDGLRMPPRSQQPAPTREDLPTRKRKTMMMMTKEKTRKAPGRNGRRGP